MFKNRATGALIASMVEGAAVAVFLQVDDEYAHFLAKCEAAKRPIRPEARDMAFVVKQESSGFSGETPTAGVKRAVLVGLKDVGVVPGFQGKPQHKGDLRWQLKDVDSTGRRFLLTQRVTITWGGDTMPSGLRKVVDAIRMGYGKAPLTQAECDAGVDLEPYFGQNAKLMLVHNPGSNGKVFANVKMVIPIEDPENDIKVEGDITQGVINAAAAQAAGGQTYAERARIAAENTLRSIAQAESEEKIDPAEAAL